jgi:thioredoxin-related protein
MKDNRLAVIFFLVLWGHGVIGQTDNKKGIQFFQGSWSELLGAAKEQRKMIFLDVYTDWCGPCKLMDKNVFPVEKVGSKYNPVFLSYKVNAEKGEGVEIAKRFNVSAYPTFLFLDSNGVLIQKAMGEKQIDPFISLADQALKGVVDTNNLNALEEQFNKGVREPALLCAYISRLNQLDMDNSKVLDEYFGALSFSALHQEETLVFIGQNIMNTRSAGFIFFMDHYDKLSRESKDKVTNNLYQKLIGRSASQALGDKNLLELKQLLTFADKLENLDYSKRFYINRLWLAYFDLVRDNKQIIETGYALAAGLADISIDSIRSEDARRFKNVMQPFLTGERDSTKIPGFQEERKYLEKMYTKDISSKLYLVVQVFVKLPDTEIRALKDALVWIKRSRLLEPDVKPYSDLAAQLEKRIRSL